MSDNGITTISMKFKTKERLSAFGRYDESADDLINRLLDTIDECKKVNKDGE